MRKYYGLIVVLLVVLAGCVKTGRLDKDWQSIQATLESIYYNQDTLLVNRIRYEENATYDRIVSYQKISENTFLIHVVDQSTDQDTLIEYSLFITSEYLYDTRSMEKTRHEVDLMDTEKFNAWILALTEIIDFRVFENDYIAELLKSFNITTHRRIDRNTNHLRGERRHTQHPDWLHVIEIRYGQGIAKELQFREEHDFDSTKQVSNLISTTAYYFSENIEQGFPNLDLFTEGD